MKFLACRTKYSASLLSFRSTCRAAGKKHQSQEQTENLTTQMCTVFDLLRRKVKKMSSAFRARNFFFFKKEREKKTIFNTVNEKYFEFKNMIGFFVWNFTSLGECIRANTVRDV